jgi:hypothetical protein
LIEHLDIQVHCRDIHGGALVPGAVPSATSDHLNVEGSVRIQYQRFGKRALGY